jgi:hypothetical protein
MMNIALYIGRVALACVLAFFAREKGQKLLENYGDTKVHNGRTVIRKTLQ